MKPRFLVTAGNSREAIDDVRMWSNIFSGTTGLNIAKALAGVGDVDLLTSNAAHVREINQVPAERNAIAASSFGSHAELKGALAALLARDRYEGVFMTAAVADYKPVRVYAVLDRRIDPAGLEQWTVKDVQARKVKSSHRQIAVLAEQTEKIINLFRTTWNYTGLLVKFKLEVAVNADVLLRLGQQSRRASGAEYLFANTLAMTTGPDAGAFLLSDAGHEWVPRAQLAGRAAELVKSHLRERHQGAARP